LDSAIGLMDNISRVAGSPDLRALPTDLRATIGEVRGTVEDVRNVIGSEDIQALPGRITAVADQLEILVSDLNERDVAGRVLAAFDATQEAAADVSKVSQGLPELFESIDAVAKKAANLEIEQLTEELTGLTRNARTLLGSDQAQALPAAVTATLAEIDTILSEAREQGMTDSIVTALNAARDAAGTVSRSFEGVPDLVDRLNAVAAKAETVPLDQLAQSERPLALVWQAGQGGEARFLSGIALIAALNGVLAQIVMAARVLFGLGARNAWLAGFHHAHPRLGTPLRASILVGLAVIAGALVLPVATLAGITSSVLLAVFVVVNLALILLKRRAPDAPFRVPMAVPVVGLVLSLGALSLTLAGG
ncbi:MAG: APC family permease, partial [Pseudooceanicola atlanticus]